MSLIRTTGRLAALLTVPAVLYAPATAGADEPELVEQCSTFALTDEEVAAGEVSEVTCILVPPGEQGPVDLGRGGEPAMATHFDGYGAGGSALTIYGSVCDGSMVFNSTHAWNDRISSTVNWACGNTKHFVDSNLGGASQLVDSGAGYPTNMNGTLNNQVSSIGYDY